MHKQNNGFTLIELIVVVAAIAILATITALGTTKYLANGRDAERSTASRLVSEALEKYYEENGEYPSVPALTTGSSDSVAKILSVDQNAVTKISNRNELAIVSPGSPDASQEDAIIYDASSTVNNNVCQSGPKSGCDKYTLSYKNESGEVVSINSRRDGGAYGTIATAPPSSTLSLEPSGGSSVTGQASTVPCSTNSATLTPKYSFRSGLSSSALSDWSSWQTQDEYTTNGTQGSNLYMQVRTRCDDRTTAGAISNPSVVASTLIPIGSPTAPVVTLSVSGSTLTATASVTSCAAGTTAQYSLRMRTNGGAWGAYSAWSTTRTASNTAAQGQLYGYQAQARCYSTTTTSGSSASTEKSYTHPITAPAAPTVAMGSSTATNTPVTSSTVSCPANTTAYYQYQYLIDPSYASGWINYGTSPVSISLNTASQGYQYTARVQARCYTSYTTSAYGAYGQAVYLRPIATPAAPSGFKVTFSSDRKVVNWSWTAPACGTGTSYRAIHKWHWNEGNPALEWHPAPTSEGHWTPSMDFKMSGDAPFGSGVKMRASALYRCYNSATGRYGAWGPEGSSPVYTTP